MGSGISQSPVLGLRYSPHHASQGWGWEALRERASAFSSLHSLQWSPHPYATPRLCGEARGEPGPSLGVALTRGTLPRSFHRMSTHTASALAQGIPRGPRPMTHLRLLPHLSLLTCPGPGSPAEHLQERDHKQRKGWGARSSMRSPVPRPQQCPGVSHYGFYCGVSGSG